MAILHSFTSLGGRSWLFAFRPRVSSVLGFSLLTSAIFFFVSVGVVLKKKKNSFHYFRPREKGLTVLAAMPGATARVAQAGSYVSADRCTMSPLSATVNTQGQTTARGGIV